VHCLDPLNPHDRWVGLKFFTGKSSVEANLKQCVNPVTIWQSYVTPSAGQGVIFTCLAVGQFLPHTGQRSTLKKAG